MRYGYWINGILGVLLIAAPYMGNFAGDHPAAYTDVAVGLLLLVWAVVSYLSPGSLGAQRGHQSHA